MTATSTLEREFFTCNLECGCTAVWSRIPNLWQIRKFTACPTHKNRTDERIEAFRNLRTIAVASADANDKAGVA